MGRILTTILVLSLTWLPAVQATSSSEKNTLLSGVKDEVQSCFVMDEGSSASMTTIAVGRNTDRLLMLSPFVNKGPESVRSVVVSGRLTKKSPDYIVRIILKDKQGGERLVLESYEEIAPGGAETLTFSGYGEETLVMDGVDADSIMVFARDAVVELESVSYSAMRLKGDVTPAQNRKKQVESVVERINAYNVANRKLWRAAATEVSLLDYGTKKRVVGIDDRSSTLGFEYYGGGIFEMGSKSSNTKSKAKGLKYINYNYCDTLFVDNFSWRNRQGTDWLTHHKSQHGSSFCNAFASVGTLEALTNLYFNQKLDLNMSEQYLINNVLPLGGNTGLPYIAAVNSLAVHGTCDSLSCPYDSCSYGPEANPTNYIFRARTSGYANMEDSIVKIDTGYDIDYWRLVKRTLMKHGPAVSGIRWYPNSDGGHAMVLYGWGTIHIGDTIRFFDEVINNTGDQDYTIVDSQSDYIGQNYWMFKDTYEGGFGQPDTKLLYNPSALMPGPFVEKVPIILSRPWTSNFVLPSIICEDHDGDGYYNWGIGPKPDVEILRGVWDEIDGDDTDPTRGPLNSYGFYKPTNPDLLDTIYINSLVDYTDTIHIYQHVVVQGDGIWGVFAPVTFHNGAKLIVQDGGKVECIHTMENLDLHMESGGTFLMDSNLGQTTAGKVIKASGKGFSIPPGGRMELYRGKITNHTTN